MNSRTRKPSLFSPRFMNAFIHACAGAILGLRLAAGLLACDDASPAQQGHVCGDGGGSVLVPSSSSSGPVADAGPDAPALEVLDPPVWPRALVVDSIGRLFQAGIVGINDDGRADLFVTGTRGDPVVPSAETWHAIPCAPITTPGAVVLSTGAALAFLSADPSAARAGILGNKMAGGEVRIVLPPVDLDNGQAEILILAERLLPPVGPAWILNPRDGVSVDVRDAMIAAGCLL